MEVVELAKEGKLNAGQLKSQTALREDLLAAMKGDPLGNDSIMQPGRRIWERFCDR